METHFLLPAKSRGSKFKWLYLNRFIFILHCYFILYRTVILFALCLNILRLYTNVLSCLLSLRPPVNKANNTWDFFLKKWDFEWFKNQYKPVHVLVHGSATKYVVPSHPNHKVASFWPLSCILNCRAVGCRSLHHSTNSSISIQSSK